jgi:predicted hydrocarbon binding protein
MPDSGKNVKCHTRFFAAAFISGLFPIGFFSDTIEKSNFTERKMAERKYQFVWDETVGVDMPSSRPKLGPTMRVEAYRLFQFTLRDILEQHYGADAADALFREAGVLAGRSFHEKYLAGAKTIGELSYQIQLAFDELGIGIFQVETADSGGDHFIFTVDEDLDCSGLPDNREVICVYDEGFIQGILECFSGKGFNVREIDCWCTGARTCRFEAKAS